MIDAISSEVYKQCTKHVSVVFEINLSCGYFEKRKKSATIYPTLAVKELVR